MTASHRCCKDSILPSNPCQKERMLAQFLASSCGRVMQTQANTLKAQLPKIARWGLPAAIGGKFLLSV